MANDEKLKQMILYFLNKCGAMTLEKLGHLLYWADFNHYHKYGKSISDATYIKREDDTDD
jgi:hypothetical protein